MSLTHPIKINDPSFNPNPRLLVDYTWDGKTVNSFWQKIEAGRDTMAALLFQALSWYRTELEVSIAAFGPGEDANQNLLKIMISQIEEVLTQNGYLK